MAEEAQDKGARLTLGPTVNIQRSPLNGRNFECFSEDPYLSAQIAVGYIRGLQSQGVGATVKHFILNDSEFERNSISVEADERTLREICLPPVCAAAREAGTWALMSSYNRIDGVYAGVNPTTLRDILKEEWRFDGLVMSDLFGTPSCRLSQTFPVRIQDNPAFLNYPGENDRVHYGERMFVGYRWYDARQIAPLFSFGFGLSYTAFSYGEVQLNTDQIAPGEHLTAEIEITNTGNVAGKEVVQLYIHDQKSRLSRPEKELRRFQKAELDLGETKRVSFTIERAAFAYWDNRDHLWIAGTGTFEVLLVRSAGHIESRAMFTLSKSETFIHS